MHPKLPRLIRFLTRRDEAVAGDLTEEFAIGGRTRWWLWKQALSTMIPNFEIPREGNMFSGCWNDVRFASRTLAKNPGFAAIAVATIALGIGVNTGIFTVLDGVALKQLPTPGAERLLSVYQDIHGKLPRSVHESASFFSTAEYEKYRGQNHVFTGLAAYETLLQVTLGGEEPRQIWGQLTSCNYFDVLEQAPALGRAFLAEDCKAARSGAVAVISDSFWRSTFGANPSIVGRNATLNGRPMTIVGVAKPGFNGTESIASTFWAPFTMQSALEPHDLYGKANTSWLAVIGRVKTGVARETVRSDLSGIAVRIDADQPGRSTSISLLPATLLGIPEERQIANMVGVLVLAAVGMVLLIACANVANLLLARAAGRQHEIAIRLSIGANRWRLIRQLLTESLMIAMAGGILGLILALFTFDAALRFAVAHLPREVPALAFNFAPDWRVPTYSIALTLLTGFICGLAPALRTSRPALNRGLNQKSSGGFLRHSLVGVQVAACMVLLIASGLLLRGLWVARTLEPGFRMKNISTVSFDLEVGAVSETVEVKGSSEVVQIASATVSSDLIGRQVNDLPIPSRNATDLIVTMPGTQTPGGPRNTTFDGLPQATINMTMDGTNIQDNSNKSGSGGAFYPIVYPRTDAIEEVSVTSAASGAESLGEGAIQVKFVTKSGTNQWRGGAFMQERNTFFDANTYFNNIAGLPRDRIVLHQWGAHIGGPIIKKKIFIFFNYEIFRFPQSWNEAQTKGAQLMVLTDPARAGIFTYKNSGGQLQTVNLYALAAANGFPSTPDSLIANTLSAIAQSTGGGSLTSRATANDYNRNNFNFQAPGVQKIDFPQGKLDWVINSKQHWEVTGGVNPYRLFPDGINSVLPVFPGSGTVLGSNVVAGQREAFWTGSTALRSTWSSYWTSEIRFGMSSGNVLFSNDITPEMFTPWRGYAPNMAGFVTVPYNASSFSRRNNPIKQLNGSASWLHGSHLVNLGGTFSQINEYTSSDSTQLIPRVSFGIQSTDPAVAMFNSTNFPGSASSDLTNAENLYALLTGRVSSITRSVVLGEDSKTYGPNATIGRVRQRSIGLFAQDSWKIRPRLTLNLGFRLENQFPYHVFNNTYTRPGYAGLYGISGVGNLFQPGASSGAVPVLTPVTADSTGYPPIHFPSPSAGIAYVLPKFEGLPGKLAGSDAVFRAGFSIASARENITVPWSGNQGVSVNTSVDPISQNTGAFGPAGSVLFSNPALPVATVAASPSYPIALAPGSSISDYNPNLKVRYIESWNVGLQRSLNPDTVLEVRYVGNRSARTITTINLNEVNIVENQFLTQFQAAETNLAIANGVSVPQLATLNSLKSTNFFNAGLAGQQPVPILSTALASASNSTLANYVAQGQAAALANSIAGTTAQMARLVAANYPANLFQVNPATGGSAASLTTNQGGSAYNSMQVELRRRLAKGLLTGASYSLSHSLLNGQLLSQRDMAGVNYPSPFDQRHTIKLNWVYELPWGQGRHFLGSLGNPVFRRAVEGWQVSGITRLQSGTPSQLLSGRQTFNTTDGGVVLHNLTTSQLQSMMGIQKQGNGIVDVLPQSLITNTLAAFQLVPTALDPSAPYIGPANTAGQFGNQVFLYGPWFQTWDVSLSKRTRITERQSIEFRVQALNIFNHPNFFLVPNSSGNITINNLFGQTQNAYNDINSTNDPGSRVLDFQLRYSF